MIFSSFAALFNSFSAGFSGKTFWGGLICFQGVLAATLHGCFYKASREFVSEKCITNYNVTVVALASLF
jgi:hypothetical protein